MKSQSPGAVDITRILTQKTLTGVSDMCETKVVNLRHDFCDVFIDRSGDWGNPFVIGRHGNRAQVIEKYRDYIKGRTDLLERLPELKGKLLGCWCAPKPCHGDVLIELISEMK